MACSSEFYDRIRALRLREKVVTAEEAAGIVEDGMTVATGTGNSIACPRTFFSALARHLSGKGRIRLITGGPVPTEVDGLLTQAGACERRYGQFSDPSLLKAANSGEIPVVEWRTGLLPHHVKAGKLGRVDVAVLEATAITEEGYIIPSTSCLDAATYAMTANRIIVEINTSVPAGIEGMHDIYIPDVPPYREPIPLRRCGERIGTPYIACDPAKISAIIESTAPDDPPAKKPVDKDSQSIASLLVDFFHHEVKHGRLPANLLPLQFGIGAIPDALTAELSRSSFSNLEVFTGAFGDGGLDLIEFGKSKVLSTSALYLSKEGFQRLYGDLERYKPHIIIRPVVLSDCPELVARLGVIAINGAIEVDIYGHVNSSHIQGTKLISGIGGSCDFLMNAYLSIIVIPSAGKNETVSRIVPMVTHVDQTEHTIDVIVTEQGIADLRGLAPIERAQAIIDNCAHPEYRPFLGEYLRVAQKRGGHEPHVLERAFALHITHRQSGDMRSAFGW